MTIQWEEEKAKIKDEGFTATVAQAVHKYLNALEDNRKNRHTRWIWELLQNAHDASTAHDRNLIVSIKYSPEELVFLHNGSGFEKEQIQRLIFHGSTKVEDEETKGQYGSGFLATHLLSSEIDVSGQLDDGKWFDFRLARKPESVEALRESMNQAWDDFNPSSSLLVPVPSPFTTRFRYPIIEDKEEKGAKAGLEELKQCAPYVVAFNEKFARIDIKDHDETLSFQVRERLFLDKVGIQQITVIESKNGSSRERKYLIARDEKGTSVTVPLKSDGDRSVCLPVKKTPRLFSAFPLVGTESFSFPAVINNWDFKSREDRDGVPLGQSDNEANHNNQAIIEGACGLLVYLLQFAASNGWHHVHQWVKVPAIQNKDWLNTEWLRTCIKENLIEQIRQTSVVLNMDDNAIAPQESYLPLVENGDGVEALWDLQEEVKVIRERLPRRSETTGWCNAILSWARLYGKEASEFEETIDGARLTRYVHKVGTQSGSLLSIKEGFLSIHWLDALIDFLQKNGLNELINQYSIVRSQAGFLHPLRRLHRDPGIDNNLKDIAQLLEWNIRDELREIQLNSLTKEEGLGDMDSDEVLDNLCYKLRERARKNPDNDFKIASTRLFAWMVDQMDWHRLQDFPVFTEDGKTNNSAVLHLSNDHPPLAPVRAWMEDLKPFSDIFPLGRILADAFFEVLPNPHTWKMLDERGFIRWKMIIRRNEVDLKALSPDPEVFQDDERDHRSTQPISVTDIVELEKILKGVVYDSRKRGYLFWLFLTEWLVNKDTQGLKMVNEEMVCECGDTHKYYPAAWPMSVRKETWIRDGSPRYRPETEHLAKLLRDEEWQLSLIENPATVLLLDAMGVSPAELKLKLLTGDSEAYNQFLNIGAELCEVTEGDLDQAREILQHMQGIEGDLDSTLEVLQHMQQDEDFQEYLADRQEQRRIVHENQCLGTQVEDLVKAILKDNDFKVEKTGTGSDFEITLNVSRNDQSWLIEVKSTRQDEDHQSVSMTSTQAQTAEKEKEKFLLCVVPLEQEYPTEENVKEKMLFIQNIGARIAPLREKLDKLTDYTSTDLELKVEKKNVRVLVKRSLWDREGFPLTDLLEYLK